jgi:phosphoglycolate phosphatase-like HAD superfamily hydrolase
MSAEYFIVLVGNQIAEYALIRPVPSGADVARRLSVTAQSHVISVARVLEVVAVTSKYGFLASAARPIVSWKPVEGVVAALRRLCEAGLPVALVTSTTSRTRASIAAALSGAGFAVTALTF